MDSWNFFLWSFHNLQQLPNNKCSYTERLLLDVRFHPYKADGQLIITQHERWGISKLSLHKSLRRNRGGGIAPHILNRGTV